MEFYRAVRKKELIHFATAWMELESIMLSEISQVVRDKYHIYLFLTEGKGGRKRGKHQCVVASQRTPTEDLAHNPGMCPDWESNQ